ncbi:MAG: 50S ribosomal protein L35 [Patescibacteria group bacterium]
MKTNKSFTKRLKVTKNGKILARKPGQSHFNAKEKGSITMSKKRSVVLKLSNKIRRRFLPSTAKNS